MSGFLVARLDEVEAVMAKEMSKSGATFDLEIPSFRIKRSHKKSRLGCVNCKRRRVKCDEKQPSCDRCRFRGLTCEYAEKPVQTTVNTTSDPSSSSKSVSTSASPGSHTSTEQLWSPSLESWNVAGVTDTELIRHYLAYTVDKFTMTSTRPEQTNMWRAVLPSLAFNSLAVRRGIMTLAAMDLHHHSANDPVAAARWLEVAEHHGEIFVRDSRRQLRELQPTEIDSSIACSRLLATLGLVFYHVHRRNGATLTDGAAWTWLQLLRGVRPVNVAVMQSNQPVDPAFAEDLLPEIALSDEAPAPQSYAFMQCHHSLLGIVESSWAERRSAFEGMLSTRSAGLTEEESRDLNLALVLLDKVSQHLFSGQMHSVFRTVITWAGAVPKGYLDMLIAGSSVALAMYAHWLMLVKLLEHYWWIDDMAVDGIREISDILSVERPEIQVLMEWPEQMVELDHELISPLDACVDPMLI